LPSSTAGVRLTSDGGGPRRRGCWPGSRAGRWVVALPHTSANVAGHYPTSIEAMILAFPAWVAVNEACQTPCPTNVTGPMKTISCRSCGRVSHSDMVRVRSETLDARFAENLPPETNFLTHERPGGDSFSDSSCRLEVLRFLRSSTSSGPSRS
jgi:hypothetical protein